MAAVITNIHVDLPVWTAGQPVGSGQRKSSNSGAWSASSAGNSGGTPPTGTGPTFNDGSIVWNYVSSIDYTTIQAWYDDLVLLGTLTSPHVGQLWNDNAAQITVTLGNAFLANSGTVVTSTTNYAMLTAAPGESFVDKLAAPSTTALNLSSANGVLLLLPTGFAGINYFDGSACPDLFFTRLQFQDLTFGSGSTIINHGARGGMDQCLVSGFGQSGGACIIGQISPGTSLSVTNSLLIDGTSDAQLTGSTTLAMDGATATYTNNTFFQTAGSTTAFATYGQSAPDVVNNNNNVFIGYSPGNVVFGGVQNVTDCVFTGTIPTGLGFVDGGGNDYSKAASSLYVSTVNLRITSASASFGAGANHNTASPNAAHDVVGTARPQGTRFDAGMFQVSSVTVGTGNAIGVATAAGAGTAKKIATGNANGVATAAGAGTAKKIAAGQALAASTAAGQGLAKVIATGAATGAATAAGFGIAYHIAVGTAAGGSTASGQGLSVTVRVGQGSAVGSSTAVASSITYSRGNGMAPGLATAVGQGMSKATGTGTAAGSSTAAGQGIFTGKFVSSGIANATSTANAQGLTFSRGNGLAVGGSTAVGAGIGINRAIGNGTAVGGSTANGQGLSKAVSSGAAAGEAFAFGAANNKPPPPIGPYADSGFPPPSFTTLPKIIPAYLYEEYWDDEDCQAFIDAYNMELQAYLDWFNTINIPVYTGSPISGALLDWVGEGLYGIARPSLAFTQSHTIGPFNTYLLNANTSTAALLAKVGGAVPFNSKKDKSASTLYVVTDDLFKRILTWSYYKGDGKVFSIDWLKRRVMRFLAGINGTSGNVDQTYQISVTFSASHAVTIKLRNGTAPLTNAEIFKAAVLSGVLPLPFQYTYDIQIDTDSIGSFIIGTTPIP